LTDVSPLEWTSVTALSSVLNTQVISATSSTSSTSSSPTVRSFPDDSCRCSVSPQTRQLCGSLKKLLGS
jgi:hypothetical protein